MPIVLVLQKIAMTQPIFDDERLDVDRLAIDDRAVDDASNLCGDSDLRTIVSLLTRLIQRNTADASAAIEYEYESDPLADANGYMLSRLRRCWLR